MRRYVVRILLHGMMLKEKTFVYEPLNDTTLTSHPEAGQSWSSSRIVKQIVASRSGGIRPISTLLSTVWFGASCMHWRAPRSSNDDNDSNDKMKREGREKTTTKTATTTMTIMMLMRAMIRENKAEEEKKNPQEVGCYLLVA